MADFPIAADFRAAPERFLWHGPTGTAILADLHLGFGAASESRFMPAQLAEHFNEQTLAAFQSILAKKPARIVIAGDFFDLGNPDRQTWEAAEKLLAAAVAQCPVVLLAGNHDPAMAVLRERWKPADLKISSSQPELHRGVQPLAPSDLQIDEYFNLNGWGIFHGDRWLAKDGDRGVIVGHQHPAFAVSDRIQKAKMPCYAHVKARKSQGRLIPQMLLLPAFSPAPLGTNLLNQRHWNLDVPAPHPRETAIVGIIKDRVLDFGPLAGLM